MRSILDWFVNVAIARHLLPSSPPRAHSTWMTPNEMRAMAAAQVQIPEPGEYTVPPVEPLKPEHRPSPPASRRPREDPFLGFVERYHAEQAAIARAILDGDPYPWVPEPDPPVLR